MTNPLKIFEAMAAKREADERAKSSGRILVHTQEIPEGPGKEQLKTLLELMPPLSYTVGPWVAGGAVRRLLQRLPLDNGDVDLFFFSKRIWTEFTTALDGFEKVYVSDNAITYLVHGIKVQLIKRRYYECVEAVFEDFDFSICQVATDGERIVAADGALEDINASKLNLAKYGRTCHQTAMSRFTKYVNYGFLPEMGLYPKLIRKALDRTSSYDVFNRDRQDDDAWYNGAKSEPNEVGNMPGIIQNITYTIGITPYV